MKRKLVSAAVVALSVILSAASAWAHHSFAAEYDSNKPVTIKGAVQKLAWVNPHAYIFVETKDESGKTTTWAFETLSPNALARQGWNKYSLKPGDQIIVEGYLAKDGKPLSDGSLHGNSRLVTMSDGRKVFQGTSADDGGPAPAK